MPVEIIRNDITKMKVDAIVNAANETLLGGGGVDGAIHRAAGSELLAECRTLGGCRTGEAKITGGYRLPAKYVIHTVGPVWHGGAYGEKELLTSCYRNSLCLAAEKGCESVAFPLISAGVYGYPKGEALKVAMDTISEFLLEHEMKVSMVIFDRGSFTVSEQLYANIAQYIDDHYVEQRVDEDREMNRRSQIIIGCAEPKAKPTLFTKKKAAPEALESACLSAQPAPSLDEMLRDLDEGFTRTLLRLIDQRGMTDVECYKRANLSRKLFSKIRGDESYRPSKRTALALAVALRLTLPETEVLLRKAGYALSHASKFDVIVEYFIVNGRYDVMEINETLFAFDQELLSA